MSEKRDSPKPSPGNSPKPNIPTPPDIKRSFPGHTNPPPPPPGKKK